MREFQDVLARMSTIELLLGILLCGGLIGTAVFGNLQLIYAVVKEVTYWKWRDAKVAREDRARRTARAFGE